MEYVPVDVEARAAKAAAYFKQGFNCAQSVTAAFADLYGMSEEVALRCSASFGGGIGRMRETCGAACGMFLLAGLETGSVTPHDHAGKSRNYAVVQELAAEFVQQNGALKCADLLRSAAPAAEAPASPQAEARTPQYYAKRPCVRIVEEAVRIFAEYLNRSHREGSATD